MYTIEQIANLTIKELEAEIEMTRDLKGESAELDRDMEHYSIDLRYRLKKLREEAEKRDRDVNTLLKPVRKWANESDINLERLREILSELNFL